MPALATAVEQTTADHKGEKMKFSELQDGQFFGTDEISCHSGCIIMKCDSTHAVVVWDCCFGETIGAVLTIPDDIKIRETYHTTWIDAQTKNPEKYTFKRTATPFPKGES